jgi:hypothetical protein
MTFRVVLKLRNGKLYKPPYAIYDTKTEAKKSVEKHLKRDLWGVKDAWVEENKGRIL